VSAAAWLPLQAARVVCAALALAAVALYATAVPARYAQLLMPCIAGRCAPGQVVMVGASGAYVGALVALDAAFALTYVAIGLLIFWHRSDDWVALFVCVSLVLWGVTFTHSMTALAVANPSWFLPVASTRFLGAALITLFFYVFPDGRFVPGWARWLAVVWIVSQAPAYFWPASTLDFNYWPTWLYYSVSMGFLGVMVGLQVYRYREESSAAQRRQTKWVVYGIGLALAGYLMVLLAGFVTTAQPGTAGYVLYAGALNASLLPIPISIGIAVLRDNLYDIDVLINRSLIYGALTGTVVALYTCCVFAMGWLARGLLGQQDNSLEIVVSTLGVAALVQPLRQRIQRGIDRRFYRRRYNAARALEAFGGATRHEVDLERLGAQLVSVVERTMEPAHVSIVLLGPPRAQTLAQAQPRGTPGRDRAKGALLARSRVKTARNGRRNGAETMDIYTSGESGRKAAGERGEARR
jgi:hypothetical protein